MSGAGRGQYLKEEACGGVERRRRSTTDGNRKAAAAVLQTDGRGRRDGRWDATLSRGETGEERVTWGAVRWASARRYIDT